MCGVNLLIHSQTSTVQPLKLVKGLVILSHTSLGMWLLIHAEIKSVKESLLVKVAPDAHHANERQRKVGGALLYFKVF